MKIIDRNNIPLKQYSLQITGTNSFSNVRSVGIPYQTINGWRIQVQIQGTISSASSGSVTITGITSEPLSPQVLACRVSNNWNVATISTSTNVIDYSSGSANTQVNICGDIELSSKPTWLE